MIWLYVFGIIALIFLAASFFGAPYVPTHKKRLRDAFNDLYTLRPEDVVVDIGSGDGVVLRYVSRAGATAIGYEINPILALLSRVLSWRDARVSVYVRNVWTTPLPETTTVVYAFTVSRDIDKLLAKLEEHATKTGRPLVFLSYGITSNTRRADGSVGAHQRYDIRPLQKK